MNISDLLHQTDAALSRGEAAVDAILRSMAGRVADGGRLDIARLEQLQPEAFRLAQGHTQCRAAREMMRYGQQGELEALLAAGFGGLTPQMLREQLPYLGLRLDRAGGEMRAFAGDEDVASVIRETAATAFNARLLDMMRVARALGI